MTHFLVALLVLGYPLIVYQGLDRFGVQTLSLFVIGALFLRLLTEGRAQDASRLPSLLLTGAALLILICGAWYWESELALLCLPSLVSVAWGLVFAGSMLRGRESFVERLARLRYGTAVLPPTASTYCRRVTGTWAAFFFVNAALSGSLALWGPVAWWALYTGLIGYAFMLSVMGLEYYYRCTRVKPVADREARAMGLLPPLAIELSSRNVERSATRRPGAPHQT